MKIILDTPRDHNYTVKIQHGVAWVIYPVPDTRGWPICEVPTNMSHDQISELILDLPIMQMPLQEMHRYALDALCNACVRLGIH